MANDPQGDFPANPHLTAIAVNYTNPDKALIADEVLPRDDTLSEELFTYQQSTDVHEGFRLPETAVGPRGRVQRLGVGMTEVPASTEDEAIEVELSARDMKREGAKEHATARATNIIQLRHEVKVGALVMDPANYPTSQKVALTGTDQLDNASYDGNVLEVINDSLATMLLRGNIMCMNHITWAKFRAKAEIVQAVLGTAATKGLAAPEDVARLFGLQAVLIGEGWLNTSKKGQTPVLESAWGNAIALLHRDRTASHAGGITFGFTAQYGKRKVVDYKDINVGADGGHIVRVSEKVKPVICAPYAGYLINDVLAA